MSPRARLALLLSFLTIAALASPASAEFDEGRVTIVPTIGHITFDAKTPWNSIDPTVLYGGRVGVMVNRWIGFDANVGIAFANGDYGYRPDGMGGFIESENNAMKTDVLYFSMDMVFHPLEGRLDPWVLLGASFMRYEYDFDSAGFKQWLSDQGATFDLGDLKATSGFEFGVGLSWAYLVTDNSRWALVADIRDVWVSPRKLEAFDEDDNQIIESDWGHNLLVNVGFEFSWGYTGSGE